MLKVLGQYESNDGRIGRGGPDVAGNADIATGYQIYVNGGPAVVGGTSAVAPLWSSLAARLLQLPGGPQRIDNEWLYSLDDSALQDITEGSNAIAATGAIEATAGYDTGSRMGCVHGPWLASEPPLGVTSERTNNE